MAENLKYGEVAEFMAWRKARQQEIDDKAWVLRHSLQDAVPINLLSLMLEGGEDSVLSDIMRCGSSSRSYVANDAYRIALKSTEELYALFSGLCGRWNDVVDVRLKWVDPESKAMLEVSFMAVQKPQNRS